MGLTVRFTIGTSLIVWLLRLTRVRLVWHRFSLEHHVVAFRRLLAACSEAKFASYSDCESRQCLLRSPHPGLPSCGDHEFRIEVGSLRPGTVPITTELPGCYIPRPC